MIYKTCLTSLFPSFWAENFIGGIPSRLRPSLERFGQFWQKLTTHPNPQRVELFHNILKSLCEPLKV